MIFIPQCRKGGADCNQNTNSLCPLEYQQVQIIRQVDTTLKGAVYHTTGRDVVQYSQIKSFTTQKAKLEPDLWVL